MSAFGLIRLAWRELWNRNQSSTILFLAFWYSVVTGLYQSFVSARLGPALPSALKTFNPMRGLNLATILPHLSHGLLVRLVLVYATLILVIAPFGVAGLYGGVGDALRTPARTNLLAFFRYASQNFWRALGFLVIALIVAGAGFLLVGLLGSLLGLLAHALGMLAGLLLVALVLGFLTFLISVFLYWLGAMFYGQEPVLHALGEALGWLLHHVGFALRFGILLMGILIVASLILMVMLVVPVLGPMAAVVLGGMIAPAFLAVLAAVYYREAIRSGARPVM